MQIICHGLKDDDFEVEFIDRKAFLGRDESNSIVVMADGVSRKHAILVEEDGELFLQDNDSLNGTYLNYNQIHDRHNLANGDIIQIGYQLIKVDFLPDQKVILDFVPPEQTVILSRPTLGATIVSEFGTAGDPVDATPRDSNLYPRKTELAPSSADEIEHTMVMPETISGSSSAKEVFSGRGELGKYIILKRIGKGGMGEVYLAKHKTLGIFRALKVLSKDVTDDNAKNLDRFLREAKLASEIRHPNVVGVMDVETDPACGVPYIVMEYVDGGSLRNSLTVCKRLSEEQAVVIVEAIASALQTAEAHSIVHRDIKPDNIMFTKEGEVKLADLGIAKVVGTDIDLTKTNMMIGTPAYLPPEQARNAKGVDARADIYSLGATFYEMLTGQPPYPGENAIEVLHQLFLSPVPDPRNVNPEVSNASAAIVMKMLAKDPGDRFLNAGKLLETMEWTYPRHTAHESVELIQKVIAGECWNSTSFSAGISSPQFSRKRSMLTFRKLVRLVVILFVLSCLSVGLIFVLKGKSETFSSISAFLEYHFLTTMDKWIITRLKTVANSAWFHINIKTTPFSKIYVTSPDGERKKCLSDKDGHCTLVEQQPGQYKIEISRDGYPSLTHDFVLKKDVILELPLDNISRSNPSSGSGSAKQNAGSNGNPSSGSGSAKQNAALKNNPLLVTTDLDIVNPNDDVNSLREAIDYAQKQGGNMTVTFAKNYIITLSSSLAISNSITINGGKNKITIIGPKTEPMFIVSKTDLSLTLKTLVLLSDYSGNNAGILNISCETNAYHFEAFWNSGVILDNTPGLVKLVSVKDGGKAKRLWSFSGFGIIMNGTSHLHRLSGANGATVRIGPESILEDSTLTGRYDRRDGDFMVYGTLKNSSVSDFGDIYIFNGGNGEKLTVKSRGLIENRPGGTINGMSVEFGAVYGYALNRAANKEQIRGKISIGGVTKAPASTLANAVSTVGKETDIIFDLTERVEKSGFSFLYETDLQRYTIQNSDPPQSIIDNMVLFSGARSYTVKIKEDQSPGTFILADNVKVFNSPVSLEIGGVTYSKSLSVGKSFSTNNQVFSLSLQKQGKNASTGSNTLILTIMRR